MNGNLLLHVSATALNSVLLLGITIPILWLLKNRSASFRHQLLVGTFLGLLILPFLVLILPTWNIPAISQLRVGEAFPGLFAQTNFEEGTKQSSDLLAAESGSLMIGPEIGDSPRTTINRNAAGSLTSPGNESADESKTLTQFLGQIFETGIPSIALLIWGAGVLAVFILQIVRWAGAGFITEMASTTENNRLKTLVDRICREMGIATSVMLLKSGISAVTMTWGVFKPYIVLPADADEWNETKIEAVLRHELAHIRRKDNLVQFFTVFVCALYWFNPLTWKMLRRLQMEREIACDDFVLNSGTASSTYARYLMDISIKLSGPKSREIIPAMMIHSSNIKKRLLNILNPQANRKPAAITSVAVCLLLILSASMPVAAFRLWGEASKSPDATYHMKGSTKYDGENLWLLDVNLYNKSRDFEVEADEVILDPESPDGYRFGSDDGYLIIRTEHGGEELEYRAEGDDFDIETFFYCDGKEHRFTRKQTRQFRKLVDRLTGIFGWQRSDRDDRESTARVNVRPRIRVRPRPDISLDPRIDLLTFPDDHQAWDLPDYSYRMSGSSADHEEGVLLTDVSLENNTGDFRAEIDRIILNPDDSLGFHFWRGAGYINLIREKDGKDYEYRMKGRQIRRDFKIEKSFYIDGKRGEFNNKRLREFRKMVDIVLGIFGPMHGYHTDRREREKDSRTILLRDDGDDVFTVLIPEGDGDLLISRPVTPKRTFEVLDGSGLITVDLDASQLDNDDLIISVSRDGVVDIEENGTLLEFMERLGDEFEGIRDYHENMMQDRAAQWAIQDAYDSRERRIERIIDKMKKDLRDESDVNHAIKCVDGVFDQYLSIARDALDELDNRRSQRVLKKALIDFYEEIDQMAESHLDFLDSCNRKIPWRQEKEEIYTAITENSSKAIKEIVKR